ncbi:hypothetical protein CYA_1335 [Synechococcus sp. JA-3-3Ab]|nr:hypothetical protein CYA_1335 [Synechococcus sp. JA-3-3Ab]
MEASGSPCPQVVLALSAARHGQKQLELAWDRAPGSAGVTQPIGMLLG